MHYAWTPPTRMHKEIVHLRYHCVKRMYPYLSLDWIDVDPVVEEKMTKEHFEHVKEQLGLFIKDD